ncbi:MAG: hypothetical protein N3B18_00530 [Desulfobacterota bacterium]|nr:hypothetical protein [Thermodesulfobacteriota bacterium]
MSRADMFQNTTREDWMTPQLEEKLRSIAAENKITCAQAQQFARENGIPMNKMKAFLDVLKLKVYNCQLGCF